MGIAGIYNQWRAPDGTLSWSFAMLTVNADGHLVYQRMHRPGDEKRMIVILDPKDYDKRLQCSPAEAKAFFRQWQGSFEAFPAPLRRGPGAT
jgi:putative SOS response-associated peptidase YedK